MYSKVSRLVSASRFVGEKTNNYVNERMVKGIVSWRNKLNGEMHTNEKKQMIELVNKNIKFLFWK